MIARARSTSTLHAPRIRQRVLVARGHPDPERMRRTVHDALVAHLADALATAVAAIADDGDDAVWRIRHLSLELAVNATWDAPQLARAWAEHLARAVRVAIENGGDGVTVMRFPSRAAYLAAFVRDAADGTAASRWWFDSFAGLRLLTRSSAIRTALARDPSLGADALATLAPTDAAHVVAQLSGADAGRLLDAIVSNLDDAAGADATTALIVAHRALGAPAPRGDEARWALRLVAESLRATPRRPAAVVGDLAGAMARLATLAEDEPARMAVVRRLLVDGNAAGLFVVLPPADAERLAPLAKIGAAHAEAIASQVIAAARPAPVAPPHRDVDWMPFAAPLLFAPLAAALPLDDATRGWPEIGDASEPPMRRASAASLVRLLAMAQACGGERASRVLDDPTTRTLAGVGAAVARDAIRRWLASLGVAHAARLEWTVGAWRARAGTVSDESWIIADDLEDGAAAPSRIVLFDTARGHWLATRDTRGPDDINAVRALRHWLAPRDALPARHLVTTGDPRRAALVARVATPSIAVRALSDAPLDDRDDPAVGATVARLDRLGSELRWLALPASLGVPRPMELALGVVAQGLLRDLAWRLPGFARASLPHLWTNFLAVDARLEHEPQRIVARLGRPPLAMIIAMTGMMRGSYALPWLGERRVTLFGEDGA